MSDLTDEELQAYVDGDGLNEYDDARSMARECQRHRAAQDADEERVRGVVRNAVDAELTERKLYIVKPQQPTMNEIVLEAYGHGRACDAAALLGNDLQALLDAIATRAAKQLASAAVRLTEEERNHLLSIRALLTDKRLDSRSVWAAEVETLDRLLATVRP